jgi:hypothetical protein
VFLEARDRLGLPIYMGEGGENTLEWLYAAFRLYETHGIGWNFWPWKKIDTRTSPASIVPPEGWDRVVAAIGDPDAIDREAARMVFDQLLEAMRMENCHWQQDVVAAVLAEHPAVLPGWGFGYRGPDESYSVAAPSPLPGIRHSDTVALGWASPGRHPENPFQQSDGRPYAASEELVVTLGEGDWLEFELTGVTDARVLDANGQACPVVVERSDRGLRIVATAPTSIARLVPIPLPRELVGSGG